MTGLDGATAQAGLDSVGRGGSGGTDSETLKTISMEDILKGNVGGGGENGAGGDGDGGGGDGDGDGEASGAGGGAGNGAGAGAGGGAEGEGADADAYHERFMESLRKQREEEAARQKEAEEAAAAAAVEEAAAMAARKEAGVGRIFAGDDEDMSKRFAGMQEENALELLKEKMKKKEIRQVDHSVIEYVDERREKREKRDKRISCANLPPAWCVVRVVCRVLRAVCRAYVLSCPACRVLRAVCRICVLDRTSASVLTHTCGTLLRPQVHAVPEEVLHRVERDRVHVRRGPRRVAQRARDQDPREALPEARGTVEPGRFVGQVSRHADQEWLR